MSEVRGEAIFGNGDPDPVPAPGEDIELLEMNSNENEDANRNSNEENTDNNQETEYLDQPTQLSFIKTLTLRRALASILFFIVGIIFISVALLSLTFIFSIVIDDYDSHTDDDVDYGLVNVIQIQLKLNSSLFFNRNSQINQMFSTLNPFIDSTFVAEQANYELVRILVDFSLNKCDSTASNLTLQIDDDFIPYRYNLQVSQSSTDFNTTLLEFPFSPSPDFDSTNEQFAFGIGHNASVYYEKLTEITEFSGLTLAQCTDVLNYFPELCSASSSNLTHGATEYWWELENSGYYIPLMDNVDGNDNTHKSYTCESKFNLLYSDKMSAMAGVISPPSEAYWTFTVYLGVTGVPSSQTIFSDLFLSLQNELYSAMAIYEVPQ